jgi:hypothetical protein
MAAKAEVCLVVAFFQQEPAGCAVRLVTCGTVAVFYRRMHHLPFPFGVVALAAERSSLSLECKALATLERMLLVFLLMAGAAIALFYRLMEVFQSADRLMAGSCDAGTGKGRERGNYQQAGCTEEVTE